MTSLTDLFNPTFLMFLGILVLVVALIVVYFESKMREQNHKINSMFSIVSTLAEDMTGMKMGINQIVGTQFLQPVNERTYYQPLEEKRESTLITVSDDEDDEEDSIVEEGSVDSISINNIEDVDLDVDVDDDLDELSDDELSEEQEQEQIKVFKLNISKEEKDEEEDDDEEDEDMEELHSDNDLDDLEETRLIDPVSKIDISELKTISINLEESVEKIDYKKLQLPKLKSIVVEKGLTTASDASKLKKAELLKLLGIE
jgi:hypothetical protein